MGIKHIPVLREESKTHLIINKNGCYFDGTGGFGGHLSVFAENLTQNSLIVATDQDTVAFNHLINRFQTDSRIKIYNYNFTKIDFIMRVEGISGFDGIFADLGVSSNQLDDPSEGFSHRFDGPLDFRMDKKQGKTAADVLNGYDEKDIAKILLQYGEEPNFKFIARMIVQYREKSTFKTTQDLAELIRRISSFDKVNKRLMRVFQALRIYVNGELDALSVFLKKSLLCLNSGGRLAILTYHSLEDRIVKEFFRIEEKGCICPPNFPVCVCGKKPGLKIVTRKPVIPGEKEINENPRSRSAKLRVAEKL